MVTLQDVGRLRREDGVVLPMAPAVMVDKVPAPMTVMLFVEGLRARFVTLSGPASVLVPDGPAPEERTWTAVYQRARTSRC